MIQGFLDLGTRGLLDFWMKDKGRKDNGFYIILVLSSFISM